MKRHHKWFRKERYKQKLERDVDKHKTYYSNVYFLTKELKCQSSVAFYSFLSLQPGAFSTNLPSEELFLCELYEKLIFL